MLQFMNFETFKSKLLKNTQGMMNLRLLKNNISDIRENIKNKANLSEVKNRFVNFEKSYTQKFMTYVKNERFNEELENLRDELNDVREIASCASDDLKMVRNYSEMFNNKLKMKIDFSELQEGISSVKAEFKRF